MPRKTFEEMKKNRNYVYKGGNFYHRLTGKRAKRFYRKNKETGEVEQVFQSE